MTTPIHHPILKSLVLSDFAAAALTYGQEVTAKAISSVYRNAMVGGKHHLPEAGHVRAKLIHYRTLRRLTS